MRKKICLESIFADKLICLMLEFVMSMWKMGSILDKNANWSPFFIPRLLICFG